MGRRITNIRERGQLAEHVGDFNIGVELGVARGDFSVDMLRGASWAEWYAVDRWADHHDEEEFGIASKRIMEFGCARVLRMTFADAAPEFADGYFDFVYVDGYAHTGQDEGRTLRDWFAKVKAGGVFAGHDYCRRCWPQTVEVVDAFFGSLGLEVHVVGQDDTYPSWMVIV